MLFIDVNVEYCSHRLIDQTAQLHTTELPLLEESVLVVARMVTDHHIRPLAAGGSSHSQSFIISNHESNRCCLDLGVS